MPCPTPRRYPRTLDEAFPAPQPLLHGPYSRPRHALLRSVGNAALWVASVALLMAMVYAPAVLRWLGVAL